MRTIKKVLLLILYIPLIVKADVARYPMQDLLFGSTLIAKAKIVSHTNHSYQIKILDIYNNQKSSCIEGDVITFKKKLHVISSDDIVHREDIESQLTGIAFLKETTNGWRLLQFPFFKNGIATLRFNYEYCRLRGTSREIKTQLNEYFKEFKIRDKKLIGKRSEKEVIRARKKLCPLVLIQYKRLYLFMRLKKAENRIDCG